MTDIIGYAIEYEVTFDTVPRCGKVTEEVTTTIRSDISDTKDQALGSLPIAPSIHTYYKKIKFLRLLKVVPV